MVSRKIKWVSSLDRNYTLLIEELSEKLVKFYTNNNNYYDKIDFTKDYWKDANELAYSAVVHHSLEAESICEIGCGSANILSAFKMLESKYSGCDFSSDLIVNNQRKFPKANFKVLSNSNSISFEDNIFDLVFSMFVLEHVTTPHFFLNECHRILKPGGKLIILCPDYLSRGRMSSQRSGFSYGTTKEKLLRFKFFDAVVTFYDNRFKIPLYCLYKRLITRSPLFLINLNPTVFTDPFIPDVDAVYVTHKKEIRSYLKNKMDYVENDKEMKKYEFRKRWLFVKFIKKFNDV